MTSQNKKDYLHPFNPLQRPRNAKELFKKFCLLSTVRGVPRIFRARNKLLQVLWACTVVIFLICTFCQLFGIVSDYGRHRVQQQQKIIRTRSKFPDVTFCSLQPFPADDSDHGKLYSKVETLVHKYFKAVQDKLNEEGSDHAAYRDLHRDDLGHDHGYGGGKLDEKFGHGEDDAHFKEMEGKSERGKRSLEKGWELFEKGKNNKLLIDEETLKELLMTTGGFYENINESLRNSLGLHGPGSFIQSCSYLVKDEGNLRRENCKIALHRHPQYFNCYTARSASPSDKAMMLSLRLFLNDSIQLFYPDDYITNVGSQLHGVKIVAHEPGSYPQVKRGYYIPPGTAAELFLKTKLKVSLPAPYGDCNDDATSITDDNGRTYKYEVETCSSQCIQTAVNRKCGCVDAWMIRSNNQGFKNLPFCANLNVSLPVLRWRMACVFDYSLRPPIECQKCKPHCRRHEYSTVLSLSKWPHESHHLQVRMSLQGTGRGQSNDSVTLDFDDVFSDLIRQKNELARHYYLGKFKTGFDLEKAREEARKILLDTHTFRRNFVSVTVKRESHEVLVIEEEPETPLVKMLSGIGGALSFWLGITLITVMEAVELLYDFFVMILSRKNDNKD